MCRSKHCSNSAAEPSTKNSHERWTRLVRHGDSKHFWQSINWNGNYDTALYIAFVDYQKAYDKVNRNKLLSLLQAKGCGTTFMKAIAASFSQASGLIGSGKFSNSAGVRQGASTSCPLFTFFIDPTVDAVAADGPDGWLDTLHWLLLMDDTVVFATSRERLVQKLTRLKQCTDDLGMVIHPSKSQFPVINDNDTRPIMIDTITISHTDRYVYLGTPISAKSIAAQVEDHLKSKSGHVLKFSSFLAKNTDARFSVKQTVWESALNSAIFYSCETWMTSNLKAAESVYSSTLKQLLGFRATTCNNIAMLEAGVCDAKGYIREHQRRFIEKVTNRPDFRDTYIGWVFAMAMDKRTLAGQLLQTILADGHKNYVESSMAALRRWVKSSTSSRRMNYIKCNPDLSHSYVYETPSSVPEYHRVAFTRIHLSSHHLRIETGQWARLPLNERTCYCGAVQSEEHILLNCPETSQLRDKCPMPHPCTSLTELLTLNSENAAIVCKLCADALRIMTKR